MPNVCDFQKENLTLGDGLKNLLKIYSLAYGFLFFVISHSDVNKTSHNKTCFFNQAPTPNSRPTQLL
jgi:hypothetical protein